MLKEITPALPATEGVAMELSDCAFPTLNSLTITDQDDVLCNGSNWVLLVGAAPRKAGMERSDLIRTNGPIFKAVGKALNKAATGVQVVVVGTRANTNAMIAAKNSDVPKNAFYALMRLDENRMKSQLAAKAGVPVSAVTNTVVWGNHSTTQYPDFHNAKINGKPVTSVITDQAWLEGAFLKTVQDRGAAIIKARGSSSAASAANAVVDHVHSLLTPTGAEGWFSAGVVSNGQYGVPEGLVFGYPVTSNGKTWKVVENVPMNAYAKEKLGKTIAELEQERTTVKDLL